MANQYNMTCDSKTIDNVQIAISRHELLNKRTNGTGTVKCLTVHFKNISDLHISKVFFEVLFYDAQYNLLDTVEQEFSDFQPATIRVINIETAGNITNLTEGYEIKIGEIISVPKSIASGNNIVEIIKHNLLIGADPYDSASVSGIIELSIGAVSLSIRNTTDKTLSTIIFNVELYDINNNLIDTIRHEEYELKPFGNRAIMINSCKYEGNHAASYKVNIIKTLTTETEKIQLRRYDRKTMDNGVERISGTLKNLTEDKADTAVIATFLDSNSEKIEMKVLYIKDIDPLSIRRFNLDYNPPFGETVKSITVNIGSIQTVL
ncbi:MAG: hypothetical protein ACOWWR_04585 [Eubacteriales bacterium]